MNRSASKSLFTEKIFPSKAKILLSGGGKEFIEIIGLEVTRNTVLSVMMGENLREHTEPLTRNRIAQINGAIVSMFFAGMSSINNFSDQLYKLSAEQLKTKKIDKQSTWLAQWLIGLTGKSVQNVLKGDHGSLDKYILETSKVIKECAQKCEENFGNIQMLIKNQDDEVLLNWQEIIQLTTAIGAQTLTIRGSDKSTYGKLFEKLILGSILTILGFERVDEKKSSKNSMIFWLSDSTDTREVDATAIIRPGKLALFDIGFIGPGNSEISKDKLSRFSKHREISGQTYDAKTYIVVDRLPKTGKTEGAAKKIDAEIIQMSMKYWPKELAIKLNEGVGLNHPLCKMPDDEIEEYLRNQLKSIQLQNFLGDIALIDNDTVDEDEG
ncbi:MAG: hypothetical protein RI951_799 [Pseudomonadota bacterium]|jgi:hypothetical protein